MTPKIRISNVSKIFGQHTDDALRLLQEGATKADILKKTGCGVGVADVSFEVEQGEIVVVMGLSGSGKSTLVRCINRLIEPTAGKIYVDDQEVTSLSREELRALRLKKFGMVFQNFALFPHRTVCQNTEYGLEIQGVDKSTRKDRAYQALEQVGLKGWEESYPRQLSGGMQQRVGLARALALDPDILLMDEAFSALDPLIRCDMQDELILLQERMQKTILFISHDLDEALKLGDRIVLMKDGTIVQIGTPEQILTEPATEYVSRFVENVDITKVLTADSVMKRVEAVAFERTDGPRASLRKMRNVGISTLFVINKEHKLKGIITAEDAVQAAERGEKDLSGIVNTDIITTTTDTPATELIQMIYDLPYPLAVVDETQRLLGVIVRGSLLGAIAERGRN